MEWAYRGVKKGMERYEYKAEDILYVTKDSQGNYSVTRSPLFSERMSREVIHHTRDERVVGACLQIAEATQDYDWDLVGAIMGDFCELWYQDGYFYYFERDLTINRSE